MFIGLWYSNQGSAGLGWFEIYGVHPVWAGLRDLRTAFQHHS